MRQYCNVLTNKLRDIVYTFNFNKICHSKIMPLFCDNGVQLKFHLVELSECEETEIRNMIVSNGGEISDAGEPPIMNFTVPKNYIEGRVMFDVQFIKECVKSNTILDLHSYKLGKRNGYDGCIMSLFLHGVPHCVHKCRREFYNKAVQTNMSDTGSLSDCESNKSLVFHPPVTLQMEPSLRVEPMLPNLMSTSCNQGGGDIAEKKKSRVSPTEKRPCHVEYETEVVPKLIGLQKLRQNINSTEFSPVRVIPHTSTEHVANHKLSSQFATMLTSTSKSCVDLPDSNKSQVKSSDMNGRSVDGQEKDRNKHKERHESPVNFREKHLKKSGEKCLVCFAHNYKQISNKSEEINYIDLVSDSDKNTSNNSNYVPSCEEKRNSDYNSDSSITETRDNKLAHRRFVKNRSASSAVVKLRKRVNKYYREDDSDSDNSIQSVQCLSSTPNNKIKKKYTREKIHLRDRNSRETQNKKINREDNNIMLRNLMHRVKPRLRPDTFPADDADESCERNDNTYSKSTKLRIKDCKCQRKTSKNLPHRQFNEYKDPSRKTGGMISRVDNKQDKINGKDRCLKTFIDANNKSKKMKNQLNESDSNESSCDDVNARKLRRHGQLLGKPCSKNCVTNDLSTRSMKMVKRKLRRISEGEESETDPEGHFQRFRTKHSDVPLKRKRKNNINDLKDISNGDSDSSLSDEIVLRRKCVSNSLNKKSSSNGRQLYHEKSKNNGVIDNNVSSEHEDSGSFNSTSKCQSKAIVRYNDEDSNESTDETFSVIPGPSRSAPDRGKSKSSRICNTQNQKPKNTIQFSDDESSQTSNKRDSTESNHIPVNPRITIERGKHIPLRRNFASWERQEMIRYLIDKDAIDSAKGLKIWKEMISDGYLKHRTPMSLHNHFQKYILPQIDCLAIPEKLMFKFKRLI